MNEEKYEDAYSSVVVLCSLLYKLDITEWIFAWQRAAFMNRIAPVTDE